MQKGRWKMKKWKEEKLQNEERIFFSCFSFFKTTEICFWIYREKIRKNNFAPSEKYPSYAPVVHSVLNIVCDLTLIT